MDTPLEASFPELNPRSTITNYTTTPGTSSNYVKNIEFSVASSCDAGKSPILEVDSDDGVQEANPNMQISTTPGLKEFSVADLKIATNNFCPDNILGEEGFGKVYKGWVDDKTLAPSSKRGIGMAVAIKILKPDSFQGFNEWQNNNVKLSDFGLAMRGPCDEESHVNTLVMGTYGYAAPEYVAKGNLYIKRDVYGFGVVLLELLTGIRAHDTKRPNGKRNLVEWLKPKLNQKKKLQTIMDVRMEGQYPATSAFQAAELTKKCLDSNPENRPSMKEVVEMLKEIEAMEEETNNSKV